MKEEYEANQSIMDWAAKENPKAVMAWIRGNLSTGKFLILPSAIYKQCIDLCKEHGFTENEMKNIHESKWIPSSSEQSTS